MTTVLQSFKDLASWGEDFGLHPKIEVGSVFWLGNRHLVGPGLEFAACGERDRHPVVVVAAEDGYADIRVMTSKVEEYLHRGILYVPGPVDRLIGKSVILTASFCHRRIPLELLRQGDYLDNVGPKVLLQIWVTELVRETLKGMRYRHQVSRGQGVKALRLSGLGRSLSRKGGMVMIEPGGTGR